MAIWSRIAAGATVSNRLGAPALALVASAADTVFPRTDTPGAGDVGVATFIEFFVAENYTDAERSSFVAGLERIEARSRLFTGASFADTTPDWRGELITSMEADDRRAEPGRTWWRLKELIVYAYFTSEQVTKNVLHYEVMPGRWDPDVIMPERAASGGAGDA